MVGFNPLREPWHLKKIVKGNAKPFKLAYLLDMKDSDRHLGVDRICFRDAELVVVVGIIGNLTL